MLSELPFYEELNVIKQIMHLEDMQYTLKKYNPNGEIEFTPVYFNFTTQTVMNHKFSLGNAFQEIFYRIDNWINEGSGWIDELIKSQYINISTNRPLSANSYVQLPAELRSLKKGLINVINNDQKCHVKHISPVKIHPEGITQTDKELANDLDYDGIKFTVEKEDFSKIEKKNNICIKCVLLWKQADFSNLHFRSRIWKLDRFVACNWWKQVTLCVNQGFWQIYASQINKNQKKNFCKKGLQCLSSKNMVTEH